MIGIEEKYKRYLISLDNDVIFNIWNQYCDSNNKTQYKIYYWKSKYDKNSLCQMLGIEDLLRACISGEVNLSHEFCSFDFMNNLITFDNLIAPYSPVCFSSLTYWIIQNNKFEDFQILSPENL